MPLLMPPVLKPLPVGIRRAAKLREGGCLRTSATADIRYLAISAASELAVPERTTASLRRLGAAPAEGGCRSRVRRFARAVVTVFVAGALVFAGAYGDGMAAKAAGNAGGFGKNAGDVTGTPKPSQVAPKAGSSSKNYDSGDEAFAAAYSGMGRIPPGEALNGWYRQVKATTTGKEQRARLSKLGTPSYTKTKGTDLYKMRVADANVEYPSLKELHGAVKEFLDNGTIPLDKDILPAIELIAKNLSENKPSSANSTPLANIRDKLSSGNAKEVFLKFSEATGKPLFALLTPSDRETVIRKLGRRNSDFPSLTELKTSKDSGRIAKLALEIEDGLLSAPQAIKSGTKTPVIASQVGVKIRSMLVQEGGPICAATATFNAFYLKPWARKIVEDAISLNADGTYTVIIRGKPVIVKDIKLKSENFQIYGTVKFQDNADRYAIVYFKAMDIAAGEYLHAPKNERRFDVFPFLMDALTEKATHVELVSRENIYNILMKCSIDKDYDVLMTGGWQHHAFTIESVKGNMVYYRNPWYPDRLEQVTIQQFCDLVENFSVLEKPPEIAP